jgi:hypothetical protein
MKNSEYFASHVPALYRVAGFTLKPLSFGHVLLLHRACDLTVTGGSKAAGALVEPNLGLRLQKLAEFQISILQNMLQSSKDTARNTKPLNE